MKLTDINYHSHEANRKYWSVSQFKAFRDCPSAAMASLSGEYTRSMTDALLMGSYVDAYFSDLATLDAFTANHADQLFTKKGELRSQYRKADEAIQRAERDEVLMEYMSGEKQVIMTGELFGQPWKIKVDSLHDDKIVDLKFMKDMGTVYRNGERQPFVQGYGYDLQGFIYQEIVYQNTGNRLPFYLAVVTKEDPADIALIHVGDEFLNVNRGMVEHYLPEFQAIKEGKEDPERCGHCAWCRQSKVLSEPVEYKMFIEEMEG